MKDIKEASTRQYTRNGVVEDMEQEWPEMTEEFKKIQREQYVLFLHKQHDYGPGNISVGTNLQTKEEVKLSEGEDSYYAARRGWVTSPPNGESLKDVSLRVKSFIDELPDSGNILIVSHGNTIRAISVLFGINTESNVNSFEIKVGTILKV